MRPISSIRSSSIAMSKRNDGGVTRHPSAVGSSLHLEPLEDLRDLLSPAPRRRAPRAAARDRSVTARTLGQVALRSTCVTGPAWPPQIASSSSVARSIARDLTRRVDTALEAQRGVRVQTEAARPPDDRGGREERALEEHGVGRFADGRRFAAHDAGEPDRARARRRSRACRSSSATSRPSSNVSFSPACAKPRFDAPVELREVVGVQRLAELEHHVVRDVDDRLDRPNARRAATARASRAACGRCAKGRAARGRRTAGNSRRRRARSGTSRRSSRQPAGAVGCASFALRRAASSRAMPMTLKQSPRFGVTLISSTASSSRR